MGWRGSHSPVRSRPICNEGFSITFDLSSRFWELATQSTTPTAQKHFVSAFSDYVDGCVQEAADRRNGVVRSLDNFLELRLLTAGPFACWPMIELDMDIPDEVFDHPTLQSLRMWAAEMIVYCNVSRLSANSSPRIMRLIADISLSGSVLLQRGASSR